MNKKYIFNTIFCIIFSFFIFFAIKIHFDAYDSIFVPVTGIIIDVDCTRYIVNRNRDEYHCTMTVEYIFDKRILHTTVKTDEQKMYTVGSEIKLFVDKNNPIKLEEKNIPKNVLSYTYCLIGVFGMIVILMINILSV